MVLRVSSQTISTQWVQRVLIAAAASGIPVARLRSDIGLSQTAPEGTVHRDVLLDVWERLVAHAGDRALPVRLAVRAPLDYPDVLVLACATCSTLNDAIDRLERFLGEWTQSVVIELDRDDTSVFVWFRRLERSSRLGAALSDEFAVADSLNIVRWITGVRCVPLSVTFTHGAPKPLEPFRRYFGAPLRFDSDRCGLRLSHADTALPLLRRDPWIAAFAERAARDRRVTHPSISAPVVTASDQVRHQIRALMGDTIPTLNVIAKRLAWSARTLRRRLDEEGTSFRELLDEVRRAEATRLVTESERPMSDIAAVLGFSHPSTFHRAFVRWEGVAPSSYRRDKR
jgi:AraC-like DNA-binding protein